VKAIAIRDNSRRKVETGASFVRLTVPSFAEAGAWLCGIDVLEAKYQCLVPHIIIDQSTLHYYYFLDKYSQLTRKFTFQYVTSKE
jgi:hypothetical protein